MLVGIVMVFLASLLKSASDSAILVIICNSAIFTVLVMYLHLILDIAIAFFNIVKS